MSSETTDNPMSGFMQFEIQGKEYPCKFGLNALLQYTQNHNIDLGEFLEKIDANPLEVLPELVRCGMLTFARREDMPEDEIPEVKKIAAFVLEDEHQIGKLIDVASTMIMLGKTMAARNQSPEATDQPEAEPVA